MRKTLTVLTLVAAAGSLAACNFFQRDTETAEKPPVPATSTVTAIAPVTPPADTASMTAAPPATPEQPAPTPAPAKK